MDTNKYSVHKLRHTAATLMYRYGNVDIRALQVLLGHDSISTTQIYTHVDDQQVKCCWRQSFSRFRKWIWKAKKIWNIIEGIKFSYERIEQSRKNKSCESMY